MFASLIVTYCLFVIKPVHGCYNNRIFQAEINKVALSYLNTKKILKYWEQLENYHYKFNTVHLVVSLTVLESKPLKESESIQLKTRMLSR